MSGGSFDYLYDRGAGEIFQYKHNLIDMVNYLEVEFPDAMATKNAREMLNMLNEFAIKYNRSLDRIKDVFRAMEWYVSADWSLEDVKCAIEEYAKHEA